MLTHETLTDLQNEPITVLRPSIGWKEVKIEENREGLVVLNDLDRNLVSIDPQYLNQKIPHALSLMYLREGAATALIKAAKLLPSGLKLLVWDAWRPLEVQQSLFDEFKDTLHMKNPDWDEERLIKETQTYVSLPSKDPNKPSPHNTGGAIDLSVCDSQNKPLPMGVPFDFFGKESATNYYETFPDINSEQIVFRNNRRLLFHVMSDAGFTSYDEEYWHYDLGNQFDAIRKNTIAVYGLTTPKTK